MSEIVASSAQDFLRVLEIRFHFNIQNPKPIIIASTLLWNRYETREPLALIIISLKSQLFYTLVCL